MSEDVFSDLSKALRRLRRVTKQGRCAVATGSLPVSRAEALAEKWEKGSEELYARADEWEKKHPLHGDEATRAEAGALAQCAAQLRRQMGLPKRRQPEENT